MSIKFQQAMLSLSLVMHKKWKLTWTQHFSLQNPLSRNYLMNIDLPIQKIATCDKVILLSTTDRGLGCPNEKVWMVCLWLNICLQPNLNYSCLTRVRAIKPDSFILNTSPMYIGLILIWIYYADFLADVMSK